MRGKVRRAERWARSFSVGNAWGCCAVDAGLIPAACACQGPSCRRLLELQNAALCPRPASATGKRGFAAGGLFWGGHKSAQPARMQWWHFLSREAWACRASFFFLAAWRGAGEWGAALTCPAGTSPSSTAGSPPKLNHLACARGPLPALQAARAAALGAAARFIGARNHASASRGGALLKREATALARRSGREVAVAAARYPTLQRLEGATKSVLSGRAWWRRTARRHPRANSKGRCGLQQRTFYLSLLPL